MITLHLLGAVELRDSAGRSLDRVLAQPKRVALLSYLACVAPAFVRRDILLAILWPDLDDTRARSALNQAVGFLRRNLPVDSGGAILSRGNEELALDPGILRCDATAFRDAVRDGEVVQAADLYRGDLLAGFFVRGAAGFEEWLEAERARFRGQAINAMREATTAAERANDLSRAIAYAQRAVDLAPSDDRAVRTLLLLFDRVDDRGAAVQAYESFAARLRRDVDAAPAEETTELIQRIRSRAGSSTTGGPQPSAAAVDVPQRADLATHATPVRSSYSRWRASIVAALGLIIVGASIAWFPRAPDASAHVDPLAYAVFPARVAGADSSFAFLSEGAMNVFNSVLARPGGSHALDARTVVQGYDATRQNTHGAFTSSDAAALGARLGAAYAVTAEVAATQSGTTVNARVIETSTGAIVAQHSETGTGDPLKLTSKTATRLLAKSVGESPTRLSALSDSMDAMQAYLDGMRDTRAGLVKPAFDRFTRALEIDPTFAAAALWRAHVAWGAAIFGNRSKLLADSVAWELRDRMSAGDRLFLAALPSIGPNYPKPTSGREFAHAWERAAQANPDRPEIWIEWARFLNGWGKQAGIPSYLAIAARAADSAIALDSTLVRGLEIRAMVAVLMRDRRALRAVMDRWKLVDSTPNISVHFAAAKALGDSATARALFTRIATERANSNARHNVQLWSANHGLTSVGEANRVFEIAHRMEPTPSERDVIFRLWSEVATLRGAFTRASELGDSIDRRGLHLPFVRLASIEPAFRNVGDASVKVFETRLDTIRDPANRAGILCAVHVYNLSIGDTTGARAASKEMRELVRPLGSAPGWRVGAFDVCPLLVEAGLERRPSGRWQSPALDRLEQVLLDGTLSEAPANVAYLIAARLRREQGKPAQALRLIRRRDPMAGVIEQPASWRLEGDLALETGDRTGAIRAYTRFLEIRDRPDAGPVAAEVAEVRRALAAARR